MAIAKSDSNRGFFDPSLKLVFLPYHQAVSKTLSFPESQTPLGIKKSKLIEKTNIKI